MQTAPSVIDPRAAPYAALFLRLVLGALFILHIYRKFYVTGIHAWWANLELNGYPDVVMIYTLVAEFTAAVALPLGIFTRYVSLLALPLMIGASYYWIVRKGLWFSEGGAEFTLLWTAGLVALALLGDGAFACRRSRLLTQK